MRFFLSHCLAYFNNYFLLLLTFCALTRKLRWYLHLLASVNLNDRTGFWGGKKSAAGFDRWYSHSVLWFKPRLTLTRCWSFTSTQQHSAFAAKETHQPPPLKLLMFPSQGLQEVCRKCSRASACVFQWKVVSIKDFVPECSSVRKESFITTPVLAVQVFCFSYFPVIYAVTGIHSIESFIFS